VPARFPTGEGRRLKYRGTGTTAYEEMELAASGAVGFGCGFGYVSPAFRGAYVGIGSTFYNKVRPWSSPVGPALAAPARPSSHCDMHRPGSFAAAGQQQPVC
jgi:hypothetical protein